ncbi:hypothetical protein FA13DRAFT_1791602 [Coprinellus micaceus]|uniref:Homeobox domain-containing protein n=1 Tax=Coprinellus micaceus TaxID=71717 RepID=A0A4Y7TAY5_COPMI|nr:hypothetical protein FA13DRAFT_1791602 [Coprinellus micaceus]
MTSEADGHHHTFTHRVISLGPAPHPPAVVQRRRGHKQQVVLLTADQTAFLQDIFEGRNLPRREEKEQAAHYLGLSYMRIENWFRNRRQRQRRESGLVKARTRRRARARVQLSEPPPFVPMSSSLSPGPLAPRSASMAPSTLLPRTATGPSPDIPGDDFTFAPLLSLTVGSWMHLYSPTASLHGHLFPSAERLSWIIRDAETGDNHMITMPFDSILSAEIRASGPIHPTVPTAAPPLDYAVGVVELSRSPQFFSRTDSAQRGDGATWQPNEDWTEGRQGTLVLRHHFQGPAPSVNHFVSVLNAHIMQNDWGAFVDTAQGTDLSVSPRNPLLYEPEGFDFQHQDLQETSVQPTHITYLIPGRASEPSATTSCPQAHHTNHSTILPQSLSVDHLATALSCMVYGSEGNRLVLEAQGPAHGEVHLHETSPFVCGPPADDSRSSSAAAFHHIPLQVQHSYPFPSTDPSTQSRPRVFPVSAEPSFHGHTALSFPPSPVQEMLRLDPQTHPSHPPSMHWGMYDELSPFVAVFLDVAGEYPLTVPSSDVTTGGVLLAPCTEGIPAGQPFVGGAFISTGSP